MIKKDSLNREKCAQLLTVTLNDIAKRVKLSSS
jgi:hypothetical protein